MLKVWNMALVILTFSLCIFGTFLTRSGIVSSVHAFAQSSIGPAFSGFLFFMIATSVILLIRRLPDLKSENTLDSFLSRESSFLFNNLILVGAMFATLWGTIFPVLSEWVTGTQITVGAPFFNKVNIPIGLFLLFLTGIGPLFAWRKSSTYSLKRNFFYPFSSSIIFGVFLYVAGVNSMWPLVSFFLCFFVAFVVIQEFVKGVRARHKNLGEAFHTALVNLTLRNTRRYGGYIVHFGIVFMFIGFTGNSFTVEEKAEIGVGESFTIGDYELRLDSFNNGENALYSFSIANLTILKNGKTVSTEFPGKRNYFSQDQATTEVAILSSFMEDLYIVYSDFPREFRQNRAEFITYINPLIIFVWMGGFVVVFGGIIAMIPNIMTHRKIAAIEELAVREEETELSNRN